MLIAARDEALAGDSRIFNANIDFAVKVLSLVLLLGVLLPAAGMAQKLKTNTMSQITYTTTEYDYGRIEQGKPATTTFVYKATGMEPVVLTYVKPSCGCTMPEYQKEPLWPGKDGEIKVTYDAKEPGPFTKHIIIHSNASNNPQQILTIKGTVVAAK